MSVTVQLTVNGEQHRINVPTMKRLLDVLREDLHLTGTKEGCGEGECGACAVLMNGELVNSCLIPALQANGGRLCTIVCPCHTPTTTLSATWKAISSTVKTRHL